MLGDHAQSGGIMGSLSKEASFYGFLAADELTVPYSICPQAAAVTVESITALRHRPDISRALELRAAGIENWALSEWVMAVARLDREELRSAAAIAVEEGWHDRAIFALGNSGDSRYYEWRFPVTWEQEVGSESSLNKIDASWVHGIMRSESALSETARSSAGAIGLMQVTPATASQLARTHGISYRNSSELKKAPVNIRLGTRYLRQLLDKYKQNPVLVMGAYNAGPNAVDRWLNSRPQSDAGSWIESIPYYETRDYITRVLAFTAIYDWRMQQPVTRVSSRMPDIDSSIMKPVETTTVVCEAKS
jgi:soluble lytic murein transglycosylase